MSFINILSYVFEEKLLCSFTCKCINIMFVVLTTGSLVAIVFLKQMSLWVFSVLSLVLCVHQQWSLFKVCANSCLVNHRPHLENEYNYIISWLLWNPVEVFPRPSPQVSGTCTWMTRWLCCSTPGSSSWLLVWAGGLTSSATATCCALRQTSSSMSKYC